MTVGWQCQEVGAGGGSIASVASRPASGYFDTGLLQAADYDTALAPLDDPGLWAVGACTVAAWGLRPT